MKQVTLTLLTIITLTSSIASAAVPVCAVSLNDAASLDIPLCSDGCYLGEADIELPFTLCEGVLPVRAE